MKYGSEKARRAAACVKKEKEYIVQDGDIMEFRFQCSKKLINGINSVGKKIPTLGLFERKK